MENLENKDKPFFLFGKRLFIGFVKFYDENKHFGYIVCNNHGMDKNPKFKSATQNFYFDQTSIRRQSGISGLVVFQPALYKGKIKAVNVRKYNKETDRSLALSYYYNKNFINFTTKETIYHRYRSNEEIVHNYKVSILLKSGICRYELINEYCTQYKAKGEKYFLWAINKLVYAAGGDEEYYKTLNSNYGNREQEENALKHLFDSLDSTTITKIASNHPCFQKFIPYDFLEQNIQILKEDYGVPQTLLPLLKEYELQQIINENQVFDKYYSEIDKKLIRVGNEVTSVIEKLLSLCPDEHKDVLTLSVYEQMKSSICKELEQINLYSKKEKQDFLLIYGKFFKPQQIGKIKKSIDKDIIAEIRSSCYAFMQTKELQAYNLNSFIQKQSEVFYNSSEEVQTSVLSDIETAYTYYLQKLLSDFEDMGHYWDGNLHYGAIYKNIHECRLIREHFMQMTMKMFTNSILQLFKTSIHKCDCSTTLINDVKKFVPFEEYCVFLDNIKNDLLQNETLGKIYYFYTHISDTPLEYNIDYFLQAKTVDQICDCRSIFRSREDKGLSYADKVFDIIFKNTDTNGNFITDNQPEGDRSFFVGYFLYILYFNDRNKFDYYKNKLSGNDRILLSISREYGCDLATASDIQNDLLSDPSYKYSYPNLQRFRHVKTAIINIISSLSTTEDISKDDIVTWLRLYLSIYERKYSDNDRKQYDEERLIYALKHIEQRTSISFAKYGVDTNKNIIPPSGKELEDCDRFIESIWQCEINIGEGKKHIIFDSSLFCPMDQKIVRYIEYLLRANFKKSSSYSDFGEEFFTYSIAPQTNKHLDTLRAYIVMNVLNNIRNIQNGLPYEEEMLFESEKDLRFIVCLDNVINMTAKDGMKAFWRVGDRGDLETTYTDVEIFFSVEPSQILIDLVKESIPGIAQEGTTNKYSYHESDTEIASGYGRSYSSNNDIGYKNVKLKNITKDLYLSYKKGLFA